MRKFLALLTVLALGFILVACQQSVNKTDLFVSPNKIVYTTTESANGKPIVSNSDYEVFVINDNQTATKIEATEFTSVITDLEDNIFKVTITHQNFTATYNVYMYDAAAIDPSAVAVRAVSATYGIDSDSEKLANVTKLYWTTIMNKIDLNGISVLSANFDAESSEDVVVEDAVSYFEAAQPEGYEQNIKKMSSLNVFTIKFDDAKETTIVVRNNTVKPIDNQLPISTEMENTFLGYIWDWILIIPISFIMQFFAGLFFNSYAVGIFFATIIVRTIAWPIYARANDMSMKMALAQPEMNKLQNKYALKKDPASQQKMQIEMMAIYKKYGISILGCFTPFFQMPIFLAMFQVVYRITQPGGMYTGAISNSKLFFGTLDLASVGGVTDVWSYVLAAIVGLTMWLLQKISAKKPSYAKNTGTQVKNEQQMQTEKTMKTVSMVMIAMMTITTFSSINALGFYWVVGNIYSIGQSLINRKLSERKHNKLKNQHSIV
ncbi:YidC/Oxa1 family membrane protein insertase [Acholeplasma equirhinis]|uniref:YidC/Oxa1 family membrane protein insertase n=1 Tax=Acholeplasma equirhinis TaxID=555393 RepID=UPI00197AB3CF|nr:YidC/Oxa1 family membrane protein insertase [Acholeplasma equirhinis]MBN3491046.1 YidC/Oxa1 family membrane protein insertase [Acholeplasma equirhinis]